MIRTEAIRGSGPCHNGKNIRAPLAISPWLNPVSRPFATQTPMLSLCEGGTCAYLQQIRWTVDNRQLGAKRPRMSENAGSR